MSHVDDPNVIFKFEGGTGGLDSQAYAARSKSNLNRSQSHDSNHIRDTQPSEKKVFVTK